MPKKKTKKNETLEVKEFRGTFTGIHVTNPDKDEHVGSVIKMEVPGQEKHFGGQVSYLSSKEKRIKVHKKASGATRRLPRLTPAMPRLK